MAWIISRIVILQYQVRAVIYTSGITEGWRLEITARDAVNQRVNYVHPVKRQGSGYFPINRHKI
jgi:hypothetical protein